MHLPSATFPGSHMTKPITSVCEGRLPRNQLAIVVLVAVAAAVLAVILAIVLIVVLAAVAAAVPAIVAVLAVIHVIVIVSQIVSHGSYLLISFIEFVTGVVWLVPDQLFIFPDFFSYFLKPPFFNRISICFLCIDLV